MIDVEVALTFLCAIFFTLLYVGSEKLMYGFITFLSWMTTGFLWMFLVAEAPSYGGYAVALLFHGVGILFLIVSFVQLLYQINLKKHGESDLD